ncbi:MAG: hypothetical protein P9L92_08310 [Candidatus Electryonea clarkiae]|nr:hypothetical protein [Candidatus Electryonea clarkiae]MDP8285314.1 hypothetical protein [Candidatus Electryonea clarkiae]
MEEPDFTDPEKWLNGEFVWEAKSYYFISFMCIFGKPRKLFEAVQQLKAEIGSKGYIIPDEAMLLMETKLFSGRLYLEINRPENYDASVSEIEKSKVYSTVHRGPMKTIAETARTIKESITAKKGVPPTATYYWDFRHGPDLTGQRGDRIVIFCRV